MNVIRLKWGKSYSIWKWLLGPVQTWFHGGTFNNLFLLTTERRNPNHQSSSKDKNSTTDFPSTTHIYSSPFYFLTNCGPHSLTIRCWSYTPHYISSSPFTFSTIFQQNRRSNRMLRPDWDIKIFSSLFDECTLWPDWVICWILNFFSILAISLVTDWEEFGYWHLSF